MTFKEMREKYPDIIWERSYNANKLRGYKKGESDYKYLIYGEDISAGDFTPREYKEEDK